MEFVRVPGTAIELSRLGYGCGSLGAALDRRQSLALLESAFDAGITHFDVARSYGYGEAESVVGEFLRRRATKVTVTTKFGILPPPKIMNARRTKHIARAIARSVPGLRPLLRRGAEAMSQGGRFDLGTAKESIAKSFAELGVDYIHILLAHDCPPQVMADQELVGYLDGLVATGRIGAWGTAASFDDTAQIVRHAAAPRILQFPDSFEEAEFASREGFRERATITHSAIRLGMPSLQRRLRQNANLLKVWSDATELDLTNERNFGALLLAIALRRNPGGTVLFTSQSPSRIGRTVAQVLETDARRPQAFADFMSSHVRMD